MLLRRRNREEIQFVKLLEKTRALDQTSWRKTHYYEHLQKLHSELKERSALNADERIKYEKLMSELGEDMVTNRTVEPQPPSQISQLIHRRRNIVEERQKLQSPQRTVSLLSDNREDNNLDKEYVPEKDVSAVLQAHKQQQSKLADTMLAMTRNLKNVSVAARDIITKDNRNLDNINDTVDRNTAKLDKETTKLEQYNKSSGRCRMWSVIFLVMVIFIVMVLFIRLFPKRR